MLKTIDNQIVIIETKNKYNGAFPVFGTLDDKPCHWTKDGKYRMDGKEDPRDIKNFNIEK